MLSNDSCMSHPNEHARRKSKPVSSPKCQAWSLCIEVGKHASLCLEDAKHSSLCIEVSKHAMLVHGRHEYESTYVSQRCEYVHDRFDHARDRALVDSWSLRVRSWRRLRVKCMRWCFQVSTKKKQSKTLSRLYKEQPGAHRLSEGEATSIVKERGGCALYYYQ